MLSERVSRRPHSPQAWRMLGDGLAALEERRSRADDASRGDGPHERGAESHASNLAGAARAAHARAFELGLGQGGAHAH